MIVWQPTQTREEISSPATRGASGELLLWRTSRIVLALTLGMLLGALAGAGIAPAVVDMGVRIGGWLGGWVWRVFTLR